MFVCWLFPACTNRLLCSSMRPAIQRPLLLRVSLLPFCCPLRKRLYSDTPYDRQHGITYTQLHRAASSCWVVRLRLTIGAMYQSQLLRFGCLALVELLLHTCLLLSLS